MRQNTGPLMLLVKPVSGSCDLRCRYCFYADEAQKRGRASYGRMSAETLERVRRMKPNGMYNIGLSNVNQRARLYGDERCGVEIESALGVGTTITLTLKVLAQGGNEGVPHGIDRG